MITFAHEMTVGGVNFNQTIGLGLASASLMLRNLPQGRYKAINMDRFKEVLYQYNRHL